MRVPFAGVAGERERAGSSVVESIGRSTDGNYSNVRPDKTDQRSLNLFLLPNPLKR